MRFAFLPSVLVLFLFSLLSCAKQQVDPAEDALIDFSVCADFLEPRTANDGISTNWSDGDQLTVFYQHGGASLASTFEYVGDNQFIGQIQKPDADCVWYAAYPPQPSSNPTSVVASVDSAPTQEGNSSRAHLAGPAFLLWGKDATALNVGEPVFQMAQALTVCKFVVTNGSETPITVKKVEFTAPTEIVGSFTSDLTADHLSWSPDVGQSSHTVVLNVSHSDSGPGAAVAAGASADFYVGVMPFDAAGSYSIKVTAACGGEDKICESAFDASMTLSAGTINTLRYTFKPYSEPSRKYVLVTQAPSDWSGTYLVVNPDDNKALQALAPATSAENVTVVGNYIVATDQIDRYAFSFIKRSDSHPNNAGTAEYDMINSEGKYVYCSANKFKVEPAQPAYSHMITLDDAGIGLISSARSSGRQAYYMRYSDGAFSYNGTNTNRVHLYKYVEDSKEEQTLTFQETSVTWTAGPGEPFSVGSVYAFPQSVSGSQTAVTYTSSNTSVASIVNNAQIKIIGTGSTTITATAAESSRYASATATYTLIISNGSPATETDLGTLNLVNSTIQPYLTAAESSYGDAWTSSIVTNYPNGQNGDLSDQTRYPKGSSGIKSYDKPAPVQIPITGCNGQQAVVTVYNDAQRSDVEYSLTSVVSDSKVNFYNLIPGHTYYYTATVSGLEVSRGHFTTEGTRRYIRINDIIWADCANNLRDLGGITTSLGDKTLKYGVIFRGSNMDELTADEKAYITGYLDVQMDVDLRATGGANNTGRDKSKDVLGVGLCAQGFSGGSDLISDKNKTKIKNVFTSIVNTVSAGHAVYIHCFAGADRTGYICCLIEAVCGVSSKHCSIDYELTSFSCVETRDRNFKVKGDAAMATCYPYLRDYRGSTFQQKAENILLDAGVTSAQIEALRVALIEGYTPNSN